MNEKEYTHVLMLDRSSLYPKRKTKTFGVYAKSDNSLLGWICWNSAWRQYVFETHIKYICVFSRGCNLDINNFIDSLMELRKKNQSLQVFK